jgi:RimJ/RimL family protein N-acetyltransferase
MRPPQLSTQTLESGHDADRDTASATSTSSSRRRRIHCHHGFRPEYPPVHGWSTRSAGSSRGGIGKHTASPAQALVLGDRAQGSRWLSRYVFTSPIGRHRVHMHGLAIDASALGQGFATEASRAVLDHALRVLEIDPAVAIVDPRNLASIRVAEKIGMRHVGTILRCRTEQLLSRRRCGVDLSSNCKGDHALPHCTRSR